MTHSYRVAVLLSGCGVYDGSEIHESVLALLELNRHGVEVRCAAPDIAQHHVIDHRTGAEQAESRNVLAESARIARGAIVSLSELVLDDIDAIVLPGGFGVAKNFTSWAFDGPNGGIDPSVQACIVASHAAGKPIVGLCMAGTTISRALQNTESHPTVTVGTPSEPSPYDIAASNAGLDATGAHAQPCTVREISIDTHNRIITAPCYMMEATITDVHTNVAMAIDALMTMLARRNG